MEFPYGAVLKIQREFSVKQIQERLERIKELGLNYVVIWPAVYYWEDQSSPNYPFQTGNEILKHAEKIGLKIIMELAGQITSLEYAPDFMMKDEYLPVHLDGRTDNQQPYYGYLNYHHPDVKKLVAKNYTAAAAQYKNYPALYGYDIWNETMFNSHDIHTLRVFQDWLKQKYGTIKALNDSWDRVFYDWSDVTFSTWMWPSVMPVVDYNQFKKENVGFILKEWVGYVRSVDPDHPIIADNIHSMITSPGFHERPHDDWNVAGSVDEYGISFYPKNSTKPMAPPIRWQCFTGIHSAAKAGKYWVSEMQTHNQALFNPFGCVYPYDLRQWNWEAISHGAKGIIYWMWEPFRKGLQTLGRGLVDIHGNFGDRAQEAADIGRILKEHQSAFRDWVPEAPKIAILYDKLAHDFQKALSMFYRHLVPDEIYLDGIKGAYQALWEQNIAVKFIRPEELISGNAPYKIIIASSQLNVDGELAKALESWVNAGGTLITDGRFGVLNNRGIIHGADIPGGTLNNKLGYQYQDVEANDSLAMTGTGIYGQLAGYYERQIWKMTGTGQSTVRAQFHDGSPAVVEATIGKGKVISFATYLWFGYQQKPTSEVQAFVSALVKEHQLALHQIDNNEIKIHSLAGPEGTMFFAFNYHGQAQSGQASIGGLAAGTYSITDIYGGKTFDQSCGPKGLTLPVQLASQGVGIYKILRKA